MPGQRWIVPGMCSRSMIFLTAIAAVMFIGTPELCPSPCPGAPGHGEGHNSGVPMNITAAIAVKKIMEREHMPGTIHLWPGIAEEQMAAKAYFVRAGMFKDVDAVLFAHISADMGVSYGNSGQNALISARFNFLG